MRKYYRIDNLFFLLVLSIASNVANGQDCFFKKDFSWKNWEVDYTIELKNQTINSLGKDYIEEFSNIHQDFIKDNIGNFHILDFNVDGKLDIIYHGFFDSESNKNIFYLNTGNEYKKVLSVYGNIVNMKRESSYLPISFKILDYPCCENTTYSLKDYFPAFVDDEFRFNLVSNINYIEKTEFPEELVINPISFEVINDGYKLRSSPSINDDNVIATYKNGSSGICIATREDIDPDRVWWFVIMRNNIEPSSSVLDQGNNEQKYHSIGWMSSRYLKESTKSPNSF